MIRKLYHWAADMSRYGVALGKRRALQRGPLGIDYTSPEYRRLAERTVARLHPRRMRLRVEEVIERTASTKTLRLIRSDGAIGPVRAGQYVNLYVCIDGVRTSRPYSISSPPGRGYLDLTVRRKEGGFVSPYLLDQVAAGTELESSGPAGQFYYEPLIDRQGLVLLAGGSGITPFMSLIAQQAERGWEVPITLLYGSRRPDDVIFADELLALAEQHAAFRYVLVISEPTGGYAGEQGLITAELIKSHTGDAERRTYLVCGPGAMYRHCERELLKLGVRQHKIRRELYGPPDDVTAEPGWPAGAAADRVFTVRVSGYDAFEAPAAEPLLASLERHGIGVRTLCRSGQCSYCRLRLCSGDVFYPAHTALRESDRTGGYIHPCQSYPLSDLELCF